MTFWQGILPLAIIHVYPLPYLPLPLFIPSLLCSILLTYSCTHMSVCTQIQFTFVSCFLFLTFSQIDRRNKCPPIHKSPPPPPPGDRLLLLTWWCPTWNSQTSRSLRSTEASRRNLLNNTHQVHISLRDYYASKYISFSIGHGEQK